MKIDLKSVVVGLLLGVVLMTAAGAARSRGVTSAVFGFAVPAGSKAVVKGINGDAFIINVDTARAQWVLFKKPHPTSPQAPTIENGYELKLAN